MTLNLQSALPQELAQRLETTAAHRDVPVNDFIVLLLGLWTLPQLFLLEDPNIRELSSELMLHCQQQAAHMEHSSGKALDLLPDTFAAKPTPEAIHEELRNWRTPQSLDELKPRLQPSPGKKIKDLMPQEPWPGHETDEELLTALKAMD